MEVVQGAQEGGARDHEPLPQAGSRKPVLGAEADPAVAAEWKESGEESTQPFWIVRRLTQKQLDAASKGQGVHGPVCRQPRMGPWTPRFNCKLQELTLSNVTIANVGGRVMNKTRLVEVPFLTNSMPLEDGEELIFEIPEKPQKEEKKRTWKDALKTEEKERAKKKVKMPSTTP